MTVYIDDMHEVPMGEFRGMKMSHMIADEPEELHAFAAGLGMRREWYQGDHYDVAKGKRALAIRRGAVAIPMKTLACMVALRRAGQPMLPLETVRDRFLELVKERTDARRKA